MLKRGCVGVLTYPGINVGSMGYQNAQDINVSRLGSQVYAALTWN